jgi:hypothetical protein
MHLHGYMCEFVRFYNNLHLFLFYEEVQVCIVVARCVLTWYVSTLNIRRDKMKLCVQGVHRACKVYVTESILTQKLRRSS